MVIFFVKRILLVPRFSPLAGPKDSLRDEQKKHSTNHSASGKAPDVCPIRDASCSQRLSQESQKELLPKPCHYCCGRSRVIRLELGPSKVDDQVELRLRKKNEVSARYT